jgi:hypothetical protein
MLAVVEGVNKYEMRRIFSMAYAIPVTDFLN